MEIRRSLLCCASLAVAFTVGACGQGNSGDPATPVVDPLTTPDRFLLFPNPLQEPDGSLQTDSVAYAQAYYAAIDPNGDKNTFAKWKAANGFDSGTGTQVDVIFGDARDLGYGRRMTARQNPDGSIAIVVQNYLVEIGGAYAYSRLNLDAAIAPDPRWHIGTNAIEFSPGPGGGVSFVKFFNFSPATGELDFAVDLDGRGPKAMPAVCATCHGGRADPLTPPDATGRRLFPLVANSASQQRGDILARLVPLEVDAFDFSSARGFTRADQEAALKKINQMVLCSYPLPAASALPEDACRRVGAASEYRGTAATLLKTAYGGDGLPNAAFADTYIPAGWSDPANAGLYKGVVAPYCRSCHLVRGIGFQSDIDFDTFAKFQSYAARNKAHVIDRGNMPLVKVLFSEFWAGRQPETLATHLEGQGLVVREASGAVLKPGRPVAEPGPDRVVRQGATSLSATGSLYSSSYVWSVVSGPDGAVPPTGATLSDSTSARPVFNATADGTYVVQLIASNGVTRSSPAQLRLVVNNAFAPAPSSVRFADIKNAVQTLGCTGCHAPGGPPPVLFANVDRNGDGVVDATDDLWLYAELRGRVNFTDLVASKLLTKPSGNHHGGGARPGFDASAAPGQAARVNYDLFLNWILNGAPQ